MKKICGISTGNVRVPFSIDIGIGDVIVPEPTKRKIAVRLSDFEVPEIFTYSIESTIAEKFDAVLQRMSGTSLELQGKSLEIRKFFCGPIISGGTVMSFFHCSELSCVLQSPLIEERATYARPGRRICINRILYMKRRSRWRVI